MVSKGFGQWLQALEMKYEEMTGFASPEKIENRRGRKAATGFAKSWSNLLRSVLQGFHVDKFLFFPVHIDT